MPKCLGLLVEREGQRVDGARAPSTRGRAQLGGLLTTINEAAQRVAMHAVRVDVLRAQAEALGLPVWEIPIPSPVPERGL